MMKNVCKILTRWPHKYVYVTLPCCLNGFLRMKCNRENNCGTFCIFCNCNLFYRCEINLTCWSHLNDWFKSEIEILSSFILENNKFGMILKDSNAKF